MSARIIRGFDSLVNAGRTGSAVAALLLLLAGPAAAQDPSAVGLKTRDLAVFVGRTSVTAPAEEDYFYDGHYAFAVGIIGAGYYWTEHLKTEVDFGRTSEARVAGSQPANYPGVPPTYRLYTTSRITTQLINIVQTYQFFHNAWFHPFLSAGVDLGWERRRTEVPQQQYFGAPIIVPGNPTQYPTPITIPARPTETDHDLEARAFGGGGFKAYMTQRSFFRTDLRVGFGRENHAVSARLGFGVDF